MFKAKKTVVKKTIVIFILSFVPSFFWKTNEGGFDVCNEAGIPFTSLRGGFCHPDDYNWAGIKIEMLLANLIIWNLIFWIVSQIFKYLKGLPKKH